MNVRILRQLMWTDPPPGWPAGQSIAPGTVGVVPDAFGAVMIGAGEAVEITEAELVPQRHAPAYGAEGVMRVRLLRGLSWTEAPGTFLSGVEVPVGTIGEVPSTIGEAMVAAGEAAEVQL